MALRTRLAPTPSGFLHVGNLFDFLVIDTLAKRTGATVLLRIDDADHARMRVAHVQDIFDTLLWAGITWQEGPRDARDLAEHWSQRDRTYEAQRLIDRLRNAGHLFACSCSRTQAAECACEATDLAFDRADVAWKLRSGRPMPQSMKLWPNGARAIREEEALGHPMVRQKDGAPSYQLLSLADDVRFRIDTIVRGVDLLPSTIRQLQLAHLLGLTSFAEVRFIHHPMLTDEKGAKLSKSEGATSVRWMRQHGMKAAPWRTKAEDYLATLITG